MPLLLVNLVLALFLTGLIWTIQLVHYPSIADVPAAARVAYCSTHQRNITPLVAPVMLAELVACCLLFASYIGGQPPAIPGWAAWAQGLLVGVVWMSTAFLQVPLHGQLAGGADVVDELVRTNWLRTISWTARSGVLLWVVWHLYQR